MKLIHFSFLAILSLTGSIPAEAAVLDSDGAKNEIAKSSSCNWLREIKTINTWWERDQAVRLELQRLLDVNDPEKFQQRITELDAKVKIEDLKLQGELSDFISRCGWPIKSEYGENASNSALLIAIHAGNEFQNRYIDLISQQAVKGEVSMQLYPALIDRYRIRNGKKQLYGTQVQVKDGLTTPLDIEDVTQVETLRAQAGIQPVSDCAYLSLLTPKGGRVNFEPCK